MKLKNEAQKVLDAKIVTAYQEIEEFYHEENGDSYLIVFFNYLQIHKYMDHYIDINPHLLIDEEGDDKNETILGIVLYAFEKYLDVIQIMMMDYNFQERSFDEFDALSIEELEREKELLKDSLVTI